MEIQKCLFNYGVELCRHPYIWYERDINTHKTYIICHDCHRRMTKLEFEASLID